MKTAVVVVVMERVMVLQGTRRREREREMRVMRRVLVVLRQFNTFIITM
jgi:hypothetical protein